MAYSITDGYVNGTLDVTEAENNYSNAGLVFTARKNGTTYYEAVILYDVGGVFAYAQCEIAKVIAGTRTVLKSWNANEYPVNAYPVWKFQCIGTALKFFEENAERVSITDSSITGAGDWSVYSTGDSYPGSVVSLDAASDTTPPVIAGTLVATPSANKITLSGVTAADAVGVMKFIVSYGKTTSYGSTLTVTGSTFGTPVISGLNSSTMYYFSVKAYDAANNVSAAKTASATTPDSIAPVLIGTIVATPGDGQVSLTGVEATDDIAVTRYVVLYGPSLPHGASAVFHVATFGTRVITGLTNDVEYLFTVYAQDSAGNQSNQKTSTATPFAPDVTAPVITGNLIAQPGIKQVILFGISATDNKAVTSYVVEYGPGENYALAFGVAESNFGTQVIFELEDTTLYYFRVTAYDAAGNASNIKYATATTLAPNLSPVLPSIWDTMTFRALDQYFNTIDFVDDYKSIIWTELYKGVGDFEIFGDVTAKMAHLATTATYVLNTFTNTLMVIENVAYSYDAEAGNTIVVSGRAFESILDRRIMMATNSIFNPPDSRFSAILCTLVSEAFGPSDSKRHWSKLVVVNSTRNSSARLPADVLYQFNVGENLLTLVLELCDAYNLGFRCLFDVTTKDVTFEMYEGWDQTDPRISPVVFSDDYDNLVTLNDSESFGHEKNVALVVGDAVDEETGEPILGVVVGNDAMAGLNRREIFYKASQSQTVTIDDVETPLSNADYQAALVASGVSELSRAEYALRKTYDGSIVETVNTLYGEHFSLGDIVLFSALGALVTPVRLSGITFSNDESEGTTILPIFTYDVFD